VPRSPVVVAAVLALVALTACSSPPPAQPPAPSPDGLAAAVTVDAMTAHLRRLQEIADADGGSRADGSPGFDASVDYVVKALRDKGFEVSTPEFERLRTVSPGKPALTVGGRQFQVDQASLLVPTPAGGLSGPVLVPRRAAGCAPSDYAAPVKGGVAVTDDTGCSVIDKQNAALARGAAALVVISPGGRNGSPSGLFPRGYYDGLRIPVAVAGNDAAAPLRRASGTVRVVLDAKTVKVHSRNVLAQTKTGSTHDVVMVGAHLDSVGAPVAGPGINDNGTGVAAVLETALQLGPSPATTNAVRFAFWGAEEDGLAGSLDYVFGLDRDALNDIALYLNFDMLGSPNAGFFTYDGDQSGPSPVARVPAGSDGVERTLAAYLYLAGKRPADMPLQQPTDYQSFLTAGVPIGGMTTGAEGQKTNVQARLWGGRAGAPFDPNYRTPRDRLDTVNRDALAVMGAGVAFAVATYAMSIDGVNGVPPRAKRHRPALAP
jgi:hypothetical protein